MAEPQVMKSILSHPIGNNHDPQTQTRRVRGLTVDCGSNDGDSSTAYGPYALEDDPQTTGGGASDHLPAGGVPAQALSTVAINKKP